MRGEPTPGAVTSDDLVAVLPAVWGVARKLWPWQGTEDLVQEAYVRLCGVADRWRSGPGCAPWLAFVRIVAKRRMLDYLRSTGFSPVHQRRSPFSRVRGSDIPVAELCDKNDPGHDDARFDEIDAADECARYSRGLSERERRILRLSYGIGCRPLRRREIAAELRLSPARITQIKSSALAKMRRAAQDLDKPRNSNGRGAKAATNGACKP